ncbi:tRNA(Met) cytidine acetyltransferase TmcA [Sinobacterium norvegicum]|uniref:tRNA(Met) cytidine acetyltransferase TmcA n=1 Tax=Sinobacterium norvegicum TaxID=1641715 RepID=A0ABM9AJB0_9GAMM|nr:GNAT family N-acetyltransferase [Sinobacterium norvegicum]CAH0993320.1 tRNA(Met) cytidine acetyltransferase TmcA [Sinobacterium norvegicum]
MSSVQRDPQLLLATLADAVRVARTTGRRQLFLVTEEQWLRHGDAIVAELPAPYVLICHDEHDMATSQCCGYSKITSLLGRDFDSVIFDTRVQGFSASAFGIASGLINQSGIFLIILANELSKPNSLGEQQRFAIHTEEGQYQSLFDRRVLAQLAASQNSDEPLLARDDYREDQRAVIDAMVSQLNGRAHRPLVLTADRGRGKSHCLGESLNCYLSAKPGAQAVLCAASKSSLVEVYRVLLDEFLPNVRFLPVDKLISDEVPEGVDILLVDEAAAIPVPQLMVLVKKFKRVILASTVHGYEGSGRGFGIRFFKLLAASFKQWRHLQLTLPVRWLDGDPLEALTNRLLLLDAEPADIVKPDELDVLSLKLVTPSAADLASDEALLGQFFGLLVSAHYQTTPDDLRMLLDSTAIECVALAKDDVLLAAAIIVREGGIPQPLVDLIAVGTRRPKGQLVAQQLITTYGRREAGLLHGRRVMRIAVHHNAQGRGIGGHLLSQIEQRYRATGVDYLSSSFGADALLLRFWQGQGYQPIKFGFSRDAASGEHAAIVIKPLTAEGDALANSCRQQFIHALPVWLVEQLRTLAGDLVSLAFREQTPLVIDAQCLDRLSLYLNGGLSYDFFVQDFKRFAVALFTNAIPLDDRQMTLLVSKVLKQNSWSQTASDCGMNGRKQSEAALKHVVKYGIDALKRLQTHSTAVD